jgi:hypothetical protein
MPVMTISIFRERVSHLAGLLAREHEALALFISELAAFDAERCWESLGYPSLFELSSPLAKWLPSVMGSGRSGRSRRLGPASLRPHRCSSSGCPYPRRRQFTR